VWRIDGLEAGESVRAAAPIVTTGRDIRCRLVLTDRRLLTVRTSSIGSSFGLARFTRSTVLTSLPVGEVDQARFSSSLGGFFGSIAVQTSDGPQEYRAVGMGSRWLRLLSRQLGTPAA
jgi:hypothetical protein